MVPANPATTVGSGPALRGCRPPAARRNRGASRAEALRRAQRDLRQSEDHSSPYFWAAFTLTGQWR